MESDRRIRRAAALVDEHWDAVDAALASADVGAEILEHLQSLGERTGVPVVADRREARVSGAVLYGTEDEDDEVRFAFGGMACSCARKGLRPQHVGIVPLMWRGVLQADAPGQNSGPAPAAQGDEEFDDLLRRGFEAVRAQAFVDLVRDKPKVVESLRHRARQNRDAGGGVALDLRRLSDQLLQRPLAETDIFKMMAAARCLTVAAGIQILVRLRDATPGGVAAHMIRALADAHAWMAAGSPPIAREDLPAAYSWIVSVDFWGRASGFDPRLVRARIAQGIAESGALGPDAAAGSASGADAGPDAAAGPASDAEETRVAIEALARRIEAVRAEIAALRDRADAS